MLLPSHRARYGTCVLPSRPITKKNYTASFEIHKVPRKWYEHLIAPKLAKITDRIVDPIKYVAVLKIEKKGKTVHYEVWAPFLGYTNEEAHSNIFPHYGKYPGQNQAERNYKIQHAVEFPIKDKLWKAEVLKRLQKQGKCIPELQVD